MWQKLAPFLRYLLIIAFVTIPFLFSPRPHTQKEYCGTFYPIGTYAGFVINCDSYEYARVSVHPGFLFEKNSVRQSRPLFILMGTVVGYTLYPVMQLFHFNVYESHFAAYLLLNLFFLLLSLSIAERILMRHTTLSSWERSAFLIVMISNVVTKLFFWTAHQQMFTFLVPLLCICLLERMSAKGKLTFGKVALISLSCGLSLLVYGSFVLLAGCLIAAMLFYRYDVRSIGCGIALIILPSIGWIWILHLAGVSYYNHEVAYYHQFIWVAEMLRSSFSSLDDSAVRNWHQFISMFHSIWKFIVAAAILWSYTMIGQGKRIAEQGLIPICAFVAVLVFVFLYFMGFYQERLIYTLSAPVIIFIAICYGSACHGRKGWTTSLLLIAALCWHFSIVLRYGPFS